MPIICLMVRENHKMVREMSGKSQGILWGLMAGHPVMDYAINHRISYYLELLIIINGSFPDGHQAITWIGVH